MLESDGNGWAVTGEYTIPNFKAISRFMWVGYMLVTRGVAYMLFCRVMPASACRSATSTGYS